VRGADVPDSAVIALLTDKQLGRTLAHHKVVLQVPQDWWRDPATGRMTACSVMATACVKVAGHYYLDCQIVKPDRACKEGQILQLPVGAARGKTPWNLRRLLNIRFNNPRTVADLGLQTTPGVSARTRSQEPPPSPAAPPPCAILARVCWRRNGRLVGTWMLQAMEAVRTTPSPRSLTAPQVAS